jgi:hypothetical protein
MQIIGDGRYSQLVWSGTTTGPALRLQGPSKAILRDFVVNSNNYSADGIEVDNADQAGSRVFMEQVILGQNPTNLFVDGLDYTSVELHGFQNLSGDQAPGANNTGLLVTGGPQAAAGMWQGGSTAIFLGLSADNYYTYGVSNGAHVAVEGVWNDTGASGGNLIVNVTGTSTFSYAGSMLALFSGPTVSPNNFQGTAALVNLNTSGNIDITGNGGTARVLGLGLVGPSTTFFSDTTSPADTMKFLNGLQNPNPGVTSPTELPEIGAADPSFLAAALNQIRTEQPTLLAPLPSGVTDTRFSRVFVGTALTGIHLQAASVAPPPPAPPTASLSVNPTSVNAGQSSTLSWSSTNATSCTSGNFALTGMSGSANVAPSTTTSYSITCTGNGGSATAAATVTVAALPPPPPPAPTASLSANPTSIKAGKSSTLSWSSTNATSCTGGGFAASGTSGSAIVHPSATTTYSITCSGSGGSATANATVNVTSRGPQN